MTPVKRTWAMISRRMDRDWRGHFWLRVDRSGDGCWPWTGSKSHLNYGNVNVPGVPGYIAAHRIAYGLTHGGIPDDLNVLHRCDNPICCNPAHLFVGTHRDNMRDMRAKQRSYQQRKTHCVNGHEFTAENTRLTAGRCGTQRRCLACARAKAVAAAERLSRRRRDRVQQNFDAYIAAFVAPRMPESFEALRERFGERRAMATVRYFGLFGHAQESLTAIGRDYGITRERVRQYRNEVLRKLGVRAECPKGIASLCFEASRAGAA